MQNVLSRELCAVPLDLFYSNGVVRHTTKSNWLNEILATIFMGNPDLGATGTNFIAILQSIDDTTLGRFSNVADEISARLLLIFLEYVVLVVVTD